MKYINGSIYIDGQLIKKDFAIINNKITFKNLNTIKEIYNLKSLAVLPGFVDIHVHTRNPGYENKDTLKHVNLSLLYGGFTNALAQSNVKPLPIDIKSLTFAQEMMNKLDSNVIQTGRITEDNKTIIDKHYWKTVKFITDDGMPVIEESQMKIALKLAKKYNVQMLLHEEDVSIDGHLYHGKFAKKYNLKSFDSDYETNCIKRDIRLNTDINANIHLQHISTLESLIAFEKARTSGMNITAELTPHHLILDNEMIPDNDGVFKMNPPLPTPQNRKLLINAFKNEIITIIASDHAPHMENEKKGGFANSLNGVIGLETAFSLINTLCIKENIALNIMVNALSINPGKLIKVNNQIFEDNLANLTIVDLHEKWEFTKRDIKSKATNTPFLGIKLIGRVKKIIINGKLHELSGENYDRK